MNKLSSKEKLSNDDLLSKFLSDSLLKYFYIKLPEDSPEYIQIKLCELLKYLCLSHLTSGGIPFSSEIDEIWHLWILQTKQYFYLTSLLPGKMFIHHSSNDYCEETHAVNTTENECDVEINRQISFLVSYVHNFGDFTQETIKFWPYALRLMQQMNFNIAQLNGFLSSLANKNMNHVAV